MRAVQVNAYGGARELQVKDIPCPEPGRGEALVKLLYAGVNFTDIYTRQGIYASSHTYRNKPPFTIGMEGGGVVAKVGEGVEQVSEGDRVAYCLSRGSYAEYAVVPAWRLVKVPDALDMPTAVALMLQGGTAHYLSHALFALGEEHTCLVHAAGGGVGRLLVQMARLRGARVIGTAGHPHKAKAAKALGADQVVLYREVDFADAVNEITEGRGVHVVYDGVGLATFEGSLRSLRPRGTMVLYGGASGMVEAVSPLALAEAGSVFFTRPHMADYMASPQEIGARAADLFRYVVEGKLEVNIHREFELAQAHEAHRYMEDGHTAGKVLLKI